MSYSDIKRKMAEVSELPVISTACPAYGCPNAASVSVENGKWACYSHACAPFEIWQEITAKINRDWPASLNWGHHDKVAHELDAAARRRAALRQVGAG